MTVGGRFKLLQGLESITTQSSDVSIAVSENYYLTASADLNVKTSGINNFNSPDFQISKEWKNYLKNKGVAIDVGATYRLTDKITFNASLIDIGGISWKNNLYQYSLDKTKAHYTFSGIDVSELLNGSASDYIKAQTDSIKNNFKLEEGATNSYRTPLPGKMFVGGTFEIVKNFNVGAVFFAEKFHDRLSPGWTTSLNKHFGTAISTSLSYTLSNRSYNNLGAGISLNMPPFQFYAVGDNLLRLPGSLIIHQTANNFINTSQVLNIRLGLNLVVGWDKSEGEALSPKSKTKPFNSKNSNTMGKRAQQTQVKSNSSGTSGKKSSKKTVNVRKKKKGRR